MTPADSALMGLLLVSSAVLMYYWFVVGRLGDVCARRALALVTQHLEVARTYSTQEIDSVLRLSMAAAMQLCFCMLLIGVSGVSVAELLPDDFRPVLLAYGVLLGLGEAALASFLVNVAIRAAPDPAGHDGSAQADEWMAMSRGGWMRLYLRTAEVAPLWLVLGITALYVSVEEIVFRGVLITYLRPAGAAVALGVSVSLFIAVQVFHMPSWRSALFPVLGALVVGIVHGVLYLAVPDLLPLIVAHFVLFLTAMV